jgi:hypothetical protein
VNILKKQPNTPTILATLATACAMAMWFLYYSQHRLIAGDEGYYTYAARLVAEGKTPYGDFFYPQMPLMPYLYGAVFSVFGSTWAIARGFSALLTTGVGALLVYALASSCRLTYRYPIALFAGVLFATCNFVFPWYVCSLTYAISVLLLLGSVTVLDTSGCTIGEAELPSAKRLLIAGMLLGLATATRLFFAGLGPFFVLWLFSHKAAFFGKVKAAATLTVATFVGLASCVPLAILHPKAFYFGNLGYHFGRSTLSDIEETNNKWRVAKVVLGLVDSVKFSAPHLPLIIWLSLLLPIFGLAIARTCSNNQTEKTSTNWLSLSWFVVVGLFILNLIPTPTYVQYFSSVVPFCLLVIASCSSKLLAMISRTSARHLCASAAGFAFLCVYLPGTSLDIDRYARTGIGVIGIETPAKAKEWSLTRVKAITDKINSLSSTGDYVMAGWPGYLLEAKASAAPGTENHFGMRVAPSLTDAEQDLYRVKDIPRMAREMKQGSFPKLFVIPSSSRMRVPDETGKKELFTTKLLEHNYQLSAEIPPVVIYSVDTPR